MPFLTPFLGEVSPTKIGYRKQGTLILTSVLEDPDKYREGWMVGWGGVDGGVGWMVGWGGWWGGVDGGVGWMVGWGGWWGGVDGGVGWMVGWGGWWGGVSI